MSVKGKRAWRKFCVIRKIKVQVEGVTFSGNNDNNSLFQGAELGG